MKQRMVYLFSNYEGKKWDIFRGCSRQKLGLFLAYKNALYIKFCFVRNNADTEFYPIKTRSLKIFYGIWNFVNLKMQKAHSLILQKIYLYKVYLYKTFSQKDPFHTIAKKETRYINHISINHVNRI